jgi:hypothetical protein
VAPGETITGMALLREIGTWLRDVFLAWYGWVGGSATAGIIGFGPEVGWWAPPPKQMYVGLLVLGLLISLFQAWRREFRRAKEIEQKHFDEQPRFSIRPVNFVDGAEDWYQQRDGNGTMVQFVLQHYGGRIPENIRFDPVTSLGGAVLP